MKAGCYFTASVLSVYFAYLTALCGVSVLPVCISTSPPRLAGWCLLGGGGAGRSARGGNAFIPRLVLTAAAEVSGKATREFVYKLLWWCCALCTVLNCFLTFLGKKELSLPPSYFLLQMWFLQCPAHHSLMTNLHEIHIVWERPVWKHSELSASL